MAKKKHTVLTVFIVIAAVALLLGTLSIIVVRTLGPSSRLSFGKKIGVITIDGAILTAQPTLSDIIKFRKDKGIKAIIVRIDSPGGGVVPSQEIYEELQKTRKFKKIIVSMGSVAASGGFYIAAAADRIVANPGTITGSIGVIMEFVRLEELLKKIGVSIDVLKSGEFKDMGSPQRKLTEREKEILNQLISDTQQQFVRAVAKGRHLSKEEVEKIADGRVFSGERAKALGLVDSLGNFQDAVELAKKITGIKGDVTLVYPSKHGTNFWNLIFDSASKSALKWLQKTQTKVEYSWQSNLGPTLR